MSTKDDKALDAIHAILRDASELDAADPKNITAEDRAFADAMRARMKAEIAEYRRSLMPAAEEPGAGRPIRKSLVAMARKQLDATFDAICRQMGGQLQIANRKLSELSDDDLRRILETILPEEEP